MEPDQRLGDAAAGHPAEAPPVDGQPAAPALDVASRRKSVVREYVEARSEERRVGKECRL